MDPTFATISIEMRDRPANERGVVLAGADFRVGASAARPVPVGPTEVRGESRNRVGLSCRQQPMGLHLLLFAALAWPAAALTAPDRGAGDTPPPALAMRYRYVGYLGENHGDPASCKSVRKNGTIALDTALTYDDGLPPDNVIYRGKGRVVMDVDECNLKPVPGGVHDYCAISIASRFEARVTFEIPPLEDGVPREASLAVEPIGAVAASVSGDCEAATIAQVKRELIEGTYWVGQFIGPGHEAVLRALAPGGIPRAGTHASVPDDPAPLGRWTITIGDEPLPCEAERVALDQARLNTARAAAEAQESFVEMRALSNGLTAVPGVIPVTTFLQSQEAVLATAFAARGAAPAGSSRDAAEAAYGAAVARVAAQGSAQIAQVAVAAVPRRAGCPRIRGSDNSRCWCSATARAHRCWPPPCRRSARARDATPSAQRKRRWLPAPNVTAR